MSEDLSIPNPGYRGNRAGRYGTGKSRVTSGMDNDTRRLLMFAGGLGAVLVTVIGASILMGHRGSSEIPVIAADPRPIRVKPDNPGGMKIDGAENDVFSAGSDTADAKLAAAPENPDRKAMRAAAKPSPMPPVIATAPQPAAKPAPSAVAAPVVAAPVVAAPVVSAPVVAAAKPATPPPVAATHQLMVQLAALTSEDAAHAEWQQMAKRMPDLFNGRQPSFARTERDGHIFWRVRTGGFADVAEAKSFCDRVRAKGGGCSVADF